MYFQTLVNIIYGKTLAHPHFYWLLDRAHSSPGHSCNFKGNLYVTTKHSCREQQALSNGPSVQPQKAEAQTFTQSSVLIRFSVLGNTFL